LPWLHKALSANPEYSPAMSLLGQVLMALGRPEEARPVMAQVLARGSNDEVTKFAYAAASGDRGAAPPIAPPAYVAGAFDGYADGFEKHLIEELNYRAPPLLRGAIDRVRPNGQFDVLDLGCGTGLIGAAFKDRARTLAG